MHGAIYVERSSNSKISGDDKCDATYTSIKGTCPDTCSLKNEGCYAQSSFTGMVNHRMNVRARQHSPLKIARAEAKAIDQSYKGGKVPEGRDLRLRVSGDCRVIKGARSINAAVGRWKKRGGNNNGVWSYTHAFAHVPRKEWSNVSILASIENVNQVAAARKMGYAPALVVAEHTTEKAYTIPGSDVKWIPCPAQTKPGGKEIACVNCRLCMKADWLYKTNRGITFAAHGIRQKEIKRRLTVIQ